MGRSGAFEMKLVAGGAEEIEQRHGDSDDREYADRQQDL